MRIKPVIIVISILILSVVAYIYLSKNNTKQENAVLTEEEKKEIAEFEKQIKNDSVSFANKYKNTFPHFSHSYNSDADTYTVERFPFDPNTADSITFLRLGLKPWQAHNALQYRRHNGRWRNPEAFLKLYGLSSQQGKSLLPYIHIDKNKEELQWEEERRKRDSIRATLPQKFSEHTILPLNETDTTQLKRIPGIGSYYARKIIQYRERLGGFISTSQLKEIEGLPQGIEKWFNIDNNVEIRKIKINHSDFKGLVRHPYLSYEQVKVISDFIRLRGSIKSFDDLKLSKEFSPKDFERLKPYIDFEK